jgi:type IV secretory pathway VirJ component
MAAAAITVAVVFGIAAPLAAQSPAAPLSDLPLVEVPAPARTTALPGGVLVVLVTGDGNWAALVRGVADSLSNHGVAVVGLDARSYLSRPRTPDETTRDVERIARHYMKEWQRDTLVLAGYSRGADYMPFVATRLSPDLRAHLAFIAMFSPSRSASFEFHLVDLLEDVARPSDIPTLPELERSRGTRALCVYGADERDSLCSIAPAGLVHVVQRAGGHRSRDASPLTAAFFDELNDVRSSARTTVTSPRHL